MPHNATNPARSGAAGLGNIEAMAALDAPEIATISPATQARCDLRIAAMKLRQFSAWLHSGPADQSAAPILLEELIEQILRAVSLISGEARP